MRRITLVAAVLLFSSLARVEALDRFVNPHGTCPTGRVPQHGTIQDAVDHAHPGDEIGVCPGTYEETVRVPAGKSAISLIGLGRVIVQLPDIPPGPSGVPLTVLADDVRIEGLDLRGFDLWGVAVAANRATIQRNRIDGQLGLFVAGDGHRVRNNVIGGSDAGLVMGNVNAVEISGNRVFTGGGGIVGINVDQTSPGTVVHHNLVGGIGGISFIDAEGGTIANNTVRHSTGIELLRTNGVIVLQNRVQDSDGIFVSDSTNCVVSFNSVVRNSGIVLSHIDGCTIQRNNVSRNRPSDCVWDGLGANTFLANACSTETPSGAWD